MDNNGHTIQETKTNKTEFFSNMDPTIKPGLNPISVV